VTLRSFDTVYFLRKCLVESAQTADNSLKNANRQFGSSGIVPWADSSLCNVVYINLLRKIYNIYTTSFHDYFDGC